MLKQYFFLLSENMLLLPMGALAIFVVVFISLVVRTMFTDRKEMEAVAALPLAHDEEREVYNVKR